jgi:hypothetical protein
MRPPTAADSAKFKAPSAADSLKLVAAIKAAVDSAKKAPKPATTQKLDATNAVDPDVAFARSHIDWADGNNGPCSNFWLCVTYIDHASITFKDGDFGVRVGIWRGNTSAHDCIVNAKQALKEGNRGLAVEWVMAAQIHNPPVKDWLRTHPDAVVAALAM